MTSRLSNVSYGNAHGHLMLFPLPLGNKNASQRALVTPAVSSVPLTGVHVQSDPCGFKLEGCAVALGGDHRWG